MAEMGAMEMPLPDNTLPMMTGGAQFGPLEMGGMFSVVKVREGIDAKDYRDPGRYKHPEGTVAHAYQGDAGEAPHGGSPPTRAQGVDVNVVKPRTGVHGRH